MGWGQQQQQRPITASLAGAYNLHAIGEKGYTTAQPATERGGFETLYLVCVCACAEGVLAGEGAGLCACIPQGRGTVPTAEGWESGGGR